ncbi:MAG: hypothetical protein AB9869_34965 [Verrucomicrobiia bacterium]
MKICTEPQATKKEHQGFKRYPRTAALVLGIVVWFGVQFLSGRDNFSDSVNPGYFGFFYAAAFILGLTTPAQPLKSGAVLVLTQMPCYLIYPNVNWTLANLFPFALAILLILIAPAILVACGAFRLGRPSPEAIPPIIRPH